MICKGGAKPFCAAAAGAAAAAAAAAARQVIKDELGAPWYEIYADLTPEPIAAASLVG
jgi:predicted unusual protein kinase regulating ubiquinone biosynthesis (AarF/ABC1/UbiB family)